MNKPNSDIWNFVIWKVVFSGRVSKHYLLEYEFIEKIYDNIGSFKKGQKFDPTPEVILENEKEVFKKIFYYASTKKEISR